MSCSSDRLSSGRLPTIGSGQSGAIELIGAFESTYQPAHDVDVAESTGHVERRFTDLMLLRTCGVHRVRYPVRWHRVEREPGAFDWDETDEVFDHLREQGWRPIVDLVHHTSYPSWLADGFADPAFPDALRRYTDAFAERYPWVEEYTLFNEPLSTLFLCGHEAIWPPYGRGMGDFVRLLRNVLPVLAEVGARWADGLPDAEHLYVDTCERHTGEGLAGETYAAYANDRRFFVLDALLGRIDGASRPFVDDVLRHGGASLLELSPMPVHQLGLDYYAHCQWHFGPQRGEASSPAPAPLSSLMAEYADRYGLPVWLGETNLRGHPSDRATWLKYTLEQCEVARDAGVDVRGYCWFPFVDSCDWDSLLFRSDRNVDPVGVFSVEPSGERLPSSMSVSFARAAHGLPSSALPAYRFVDPVATWLRGWVPQMQHWHWIDPPRHELSGLVPGDEEYQPLIIRAAS
jgi:hypothetical protein